MAKPAWWKVKDREQAGEALWATYLRVLDQRSYRHDRLLRHYRMYTNLALLGLDASSYSQMNPLPSHRLTLNVIRSVVDTAAALIATNEPRVRYTTKGGDYKARQRAERLSRFTEGEFYRAGIYDLNQDVFQDAAITGTGYAKISTNAEDRISIDHVFPEEIDVDDAEAAYRKPQTLYQHMEIDRAHLADIWPKFATQIDRAGSIPGRKVLRQVCDPVSVVEAWHLPSRAGAKDGRRVVRISNATLESEPWTSMEYPIIPFRFCQRPRGWDGMGITEIDEGVQLEINALLQKIQRHMKLASSKILIPAGGKINKGNLTNEEWGAITYAGDKPPVFAQINAIAPQYFEQLDRLYARAFELVGISQLSAESKKPGGLDSGEAIREYNDIQSQRFLQVGKSWERWHVEIAKAILREAKSIADRTGSYNTHTIVGGGLVETKFSELEIGDEEDYTVQAWPVGLLPATPAGQYQLAVELSATFPQLQPYALSLLAGIPDIESVVRKVDAPRLVVERAIADILEGKDPVAPEPLFDLALAREEMRSAYLEALTTGVEEEKLEQMRQWIAQCQDLEDQAMQQQMPPPGMPGPGGGMPGMPPGMTGNEAPGIGAGLPEAMPPPPPGALLP